MKKIAGLIICIGLGLFMFALAGCGSSEYTPAEGSAEAELFDFFSEDGYTVTNIESTQNESNSDFYDATITIETEDGEEAIKQYILNHGFEGYHSVGWFASAWEGDVGSSPEYTARELIINGDTYSMEGFQVRVGETDDGLPIDKYCYNVTKNGEVFLENTDYEEYVAQQKEKEKAEKAKEREDAENAREAKKDKIVVDTDGKTVYKVHSTGVITFNGQFTGSGYFIVKILDSNQDLQELVCNEIGDYVLDFKSVNVGEGIKYIQIECSDGTWNLTWTGTGGN